MPVDISKLTKHDIARKMDYAILHPEWSDKEQLDAIEDVRKYKFVAFYVLPHWLPLVIDELGEFAKEHDIELGTGLAFPYGSATTRAKLAEAEDMLDQGATVLDMVANPAWLKDRKHDLYLSECEQFVGLCHDAGAKAKIIMRAGYLTESEIDAATRMIVEAGADFVKTATGAGPAGRPNFFDVKQILGILDELNADAGLKVSGVIEPRIINAYGFIRMGADRIGTRGAVKITEALPEVKKWLYPA
jgi:deoxyribose-phosphate aldolase